MDTEYPWVPGAPSVKGKSTHSQVRWETARWSRDPLCTDAPCSLDSGIAGVQQTAERRPQGWQQNCTGSHSKGGSPWVKRGCCEGVRGQPRSCANVSAPGTALATRHSLRLATELNATQLNSARMAPFPRQTVRIAVAGKPYKKKGGQTPTHGRLRFHFFFFLVLSSHSFFNWNFICPVCLHIITIRGTFVACYANLRPAHPEMNECE